MHRSKIHRTRTQPVNEMPNECPENRTHYNMSALVRDWVSCIRTEIPSSNTQQTTTKKLHFVAGQTHESDERNLCLAETRNAFKCISLEIVVGYL